MNDGACIRGDPLQLLKMGQVLCRGNILYEMGISGQPNPFDS